MRYLLNFSLHNLLCGNAAATKINGSNHYLHKSKRGNALIPAIFLLIFVSIFGVVLLRNSVHGATLSTRVLNVRQADSLAKSATDYVCDKLNGPKGDPTFKQMDEALKIMTVSSTLVTPVTINSIEINTTIKLISRVEAGNDTTDEYIVSSSIAYNGQNGHSSREIKSIRTKEGIGDVIALGSYASGKTAIHNLAGLSIPTPNVPRTIIKGSVRIENGAAKSNIGGTKSEPLSLENYYIEGDLFIRGFRTPVSAYPGSFDASDIKLKNVVVTGHVYLDSEGYITINGLTVGTKDASGKYISGGRLMLYADKYLPELVFEGATTTCQNLYIDVKTVRASAIVKAEKLYLGAKAPFASYFPPTGFIKADVILSGAEAQATVASYKRTQINDPPIKIEIVRPTTYDLTFNFGGDAYNFFQSGVHTFNADTTYNINIKRGVDIYNYDFKIEGDGVVNFWCDDASSIFIRLFKITRVSGNATVNFISLSTPTPPITNEVRFTIKDCTLDANVIAPYSTVEIANAQVRATVIGQKLNFFWYQDVGSETAAQKAAKYGNMHIDGKWPWSQNLFVPGIGEGSIKYEYGKYLT